ncbi:MAG: DUF3883 domain-containing protein [Sulfolobales archaeon]
MIPLESARLSLIKTVLDGFNYHPYMFMLRHHMSGEPVYPYAHQLELLVSLFPRRPIRVLIGDEIGLGKTVEAMMLVKYLCEVGLAQRVLILVPRILTHQWGDELMRFGFSKTEVFQIERGTVQDLLAKGFPRGVYIASIDLVKREEYRDKVLKVGWDVVVIDEAHRVGKVGNRETQRLNLVSKLAQNTCVNLMLLSATPHRGKPDDYIERIRLIDPHLSASVNELDSEEFYRLINGSLTFRRTKLDVNNVYERRPIFTNCKFKARTVEASRNEMVFHSKLIEFLRSILVKYYGRVGEKPSALGLLLVLIAKRASSSPKAALSTLDKIIQRRVRTLRLGAGGDESTSEDLEREADELIETILGYGGFEEYDEVLGPKTVDVDDILNSFAERCSVLLDERDRETLSDMHRLAQNIIGERDSRLETLVSIIQTHLSKGDRVVVFTEFRDTAKYIFEKLRERLPNYWGDRVALITSDSIEPPVLLSSLKKQEFSIEDVKEWLARDYVHVLVSTDVASEGLNLQYANVVVHYEPPWSPIKIVQRIGRVWRLGQKKDVISYTVLLSVESDLKALEILYAKLLSWYISGVERSVPIGEELEIDMLGVKARGEGYNTDLLVLVPMTGERGERVQFSEYRAWLEFVSRGGTGLEEYVGKIIAMLQTLKKYSERVRREEGEKEIKVSKFLDEVLGGIYGSHAEKALLNLLTTVAELQNLDVDDRGDKIFVGSGDYVIAKGNVSETYKVLLSMLKNVPELQDELTLLVSDEGIDADELILYRVELEAGGRPYYSEVVGVRRKGNKFDEVRGIQLLQILAQILKNVVGVASSVQDDDGNLLMKISSKFKDIMRRILNQFTSYVRSVEGRFSHQHSTWSPKDLARDVQEPKVRCLGRILFLRAYEVRGAPPPVVVEEVERKAMEIAMEYERRCGREPTDVSKFEHYDIRSFDPRSGEIRFIEVKGRSDNSIQVELTEVEFKYSEMLGDGYWLYIIYNIALKPRLLIIRNPARNVRWVEVGARRYRLVGVGNHAYTESV